MNEDARPSRWGVGPQIAVATLAYAAVAGACTHKWPTICRVNVIPLRMLVGSASVLLVIGLVMLVIAVREVMTAYSHDQLVSTGIAGLVRHPIYSAWIVFIVPALALLSASWPLMLMPLVAYAVFKLRIHREDQYLRGRFGDAYLNYRAQVNELFPIPRFRIRS